MKHKPLTKNLMPSDEFAKNFYLEKLKFLKSCFEEKLKRSNRLSPYRSFLRRFIRIRW